MTCGVFQWHFIFNCSSLFSSLASSTASPTPTSTPTLVLQVVRNRLLYVLFADFMTVFSAPLPRSLVILRAHSTVPSALSRNLVQFRTFLARLSLAIARNLALLRALSTVISAALSTHLAVLADEPSGKEHGLRVTDVEDKRVVRLELILVHIQHHWHNLHDWKGGFCYPQGST